MILKPLGYGLSQIDAFLSEGRGDEKALSTLVYYVRLQILISYFGTWFGMRLCVSSE